MALELVTIRTSTRGRNPREIEYKGIGKVTRDEGAKSDTVDVTGVLTSFKDAVELPGVEGNVQRALDMLADGYNLWSREQALDSDEFGTLLDGIDWTAVAKTAKVEDKTGDDGRVTLAIDFVRGQFKRSARAFAGQAGMELAEVVNLMSSKLPKVPAPEAVQA